jgi:hypothetical protein
MSYKIFSKLKVKMLIQKYLTFKNVITHFFNLQVYELIIVLTDGLLVFQKSRRKPKSSRLLKYLVN